MLRMYNRRHFSSFFSVAFFLSPALFHSQRLHTSPHKSEKVIFQLLLTPPTAPAHGKIFFFCAKLTFKFWRLQLFTNFFLSVHVFRVKLIKTHSMFYRSRTLRNRKHTQSTLICEPLTFNDQKYFSLGKRFTHRK